jgi:hypothetical protein
MGNLAKAASENAISLELKKDGLQQRQSGDWMLRFTVAAVDMDQSLTAAPMGTRYACVLVEINDDETPVNHRAQERDKWRDLGPTKQAGMRCKEPAFWAYLTEEKGYQVADEIDAAEAVRDICGVASRSDLAKPGNTVERVRWYDLDKAYQAWKAVEHA